MNAVVVTNLSKQFRDVKALNGVSFTAAEGTVLALLGPNGAGKTTIVRILTTILEPTHGDAWILGNHVLSNPQGVREVIGLAGQNAAVDEQLSGFENLRMIGRLNHMPMASVKRRVAELLNLFDLEDAANRPAKTYSGGMRRRLDIAAALVSSPPVLLLDEPTASLDPRSRNNLWNVIDDLVDNEGTTIILTSHDMNEVDRLADNVVIINKGLIVAEGTPEDLKDKYQESLDEVFLKVTEEEE